MGRGLRLPVWQMLRCAREACQLPSHTSLLQLSTHCLPLQIDSSGMEEDDGADYGRLKRFKKVGREGAGGRRARALRGCGCLAEMMPY